MAEIVEVIQEVVHRRTGEGFECQMCESAWIPANPEALIDPQKRPKRCPNHRCRSMRWDREKYPTARPPRPTDPTDGGGVPLEVSHDAHQQLSEHRRRTCYQTLPLSPERRPPVPVKLNPAGSPHDALAA
jgi:hypothetical protein